MTVKAKILVVDDTPANLKMLADILGFKGYEVVTASGGTPRRFSTTRFTEVSPISVFKPRRANAASSGPLAARVNHTSGAQLAL